MTKIRATKDADDIGRTDYVAMTESYPGYWARSDESAFAAVLELLKQNGNALEKSIRLIQIDSPKRDGTKPYIDEMGSLNYQQGAATWKLEKIHIPGLAEKLDKLSEKCDDLDGIVNA